MARVSYLKLGVRYCFLTLDSVCRQRQPSRIHLCIYIHEGVVWTGQWDSVFVDVSALSLFPLSVRPHGWDEAVAR